MSAAAVDHDASQPGHDEMTATPEEAIVAGEENNHRRKSGRATRKPDLFSSQQYEATKVGSFKRKRTSDAQGADQGDDGDDGDGSDKENEDDNDDEDEDEDDEDESMSDGNESVPDEEELRAAKRKATSKRTTSNRSIGSHAQKRAKIGNDAANVTQLAIRPADTRQSKSSASKSRRKRVRPSEFVDEEGLYAEVFGRGNDLDAVAADWLTAYENHNVNALTSFVNFILRCSGTTLSVTADDISDVDNAANRLNDLQEEYQAQGIVDYPLISRAKKYRNFRENLVEFIESLVRTLHSAGILYTDEILIENILVWITSMSSAAIRPFRHTTTVVSLAMVTALCHIAREVMNTTTNTRKRLETERKKKTVNKGRVGAMQTAVDECESRLEIVNRHISDCIDTVFVHRYRDVDPKIRAECMSQLGKWIGLYREQFFDSNYLRYMGWVLSDVASATRSVVVKELKAIFANKDNVPGLRVFTEKFRSRILEMALRDAETDVRASVVELLDLIREAGFLEPDDIDAVGRLIFDVESKVRIAAGKFFVQNIEDVDESVREGLEETIKETLMDDDDGDVDDFETPRRGWIKFKCLADTLEAYDSGASTPGSHGDGSNSKVIGSPEYDLVVGAAGKITSRFALATEAIYPHFQELHHWESLAGYLLYDHSQIPESTADDEEDPAVRVKNLYRMKEGQEGLLLEALCTAVKLQIRELANLDIDNRRGAGSGGSGKRKSRSALLQEQSERQTDVAHHLSQLIPQLLSKFGSAPDAAASILRLEHILDYAALTELQRSAPVYKEILGAVSKQFLTHSDRTVLAEATAAMIHAKESGKCGNDEAGGVDEVGEVVDGIVAGLWKKTIVALQTLARTDDSADAMDEIKYSVDVLIPLCDTIARIHNLSSVSDSAVILEGKGANARKEQSDAELPVDLLMRLAKRGANGDEDATDEEAVALEKRLAHSSYGVLLVYFLWKVQTIRTALQANDKNFDADELEALIHRRDQFSLLLAETMSVRSGVDVLRFSAARHLLDLYIAFGTLRYAGPEGQEITDIRGLSEEITRLLKDLVREIDENTKLTIMKIHETYEKRYAKKASKVLEVVPAEEKMDDVDPEAPVADASDDEEDSSVSEDDDDNENEGSSTDSAGIAEKMRTRLFAEQQLCELTGKIVLALVSRVIDETGPTAGKLKENVTRNRLRLGANYKEVVSYLDPGKIPGAAGKRVRGGGGGGARGKGGARTASKQPVKSLEAVAEEDEDENDARELRDDPIEDDHRIQSETVGNGQHAGVEDLNDDDNEELSDAPPEMEEDDIEL